MKIGRALLIGVASGITFAVATAVLWEAVPRDTPARRVFDAIFYPELTVVRALTDQLSPHNRDQGLLYWMVVHPIYCVLLGVFVSLIAWLLSHAKRPTVR